VPPAQLQPSARGNCWVVLAYPSQIWLYNGEGEIRTLGTPIRRTTVFETAAFNRSATPPGASDIARLIDRPCPRPGRLSYRALSSRESLASTIIQRSSAAGTVAGLRAFCPLLPR
jgi:hypothetical protein